MTFFVHWLSIINLYLDNRNINLPETLLVGVVHGIEYERTIFVGVSSLFLKTSRRLFLAENSWRVFGDGDDTLIGDGRSKGDEDSLDRLLLVESSTQSDRLFRDSLRPDL